MTTHRLVLLQLKGKGLEDEISTRTQESQAKVQHKGRSQMLQEVLQGVLSEMRSQLVTIQTLAILRGQKLA